MSENRSRDIEAATDAEFQRRVESITSKEAGGMFHTKPAVIEAIKLLPLTFAREHLDRVCDFLGGEERRNIDFGINYVTGTINISTKEGSMRANIGDWIIKGVKGEFYICKPDTFAKTYEAVYKQEMSEEASRWFRLLNALLSDEKVNGEYVHGLTCNASRQQPVGNEMCSCPIGRRIKLARLGKKEKKVI